MRLVIVESPFAAQTLLPPKLNHSHGLIGACEECRLYFRVRDITRPLELARNARYLDAALLDCLRRGEAPYASHGLYTRPGVLDDMKPDERALGIRAGFAWRRVAHATIFYVDLGWSRGMLDAKHDIESEGEPAPIGLVKPAPQQHPIEIRQLGGDWSV